MRLRVLWVGKTRNLHLKSLCEGYLDRTRHLVPCEVVELRESARRDHAGPDADRREEGKDLLRHLPEACRVVALDAGGRQLSSTELARWFEREQALGTRDVRFVVGGVSGLDPEVERRAHLVLSLGRMTWTHEMARVLLAEQIYRAFTILRGIPYHK
jgi:23S rRNA (pseudouridine1915-N3)-methyltransferase